MTQVVIINFFTVELWLPYLQGCAREQQVVVQVLSALVQHHQDLTVKVALALQGIQTLYAGVRKWELMSVLCFDCLCCLFDWFDCLFEFLYCLFVLIVLWMHVGIAIDWDGVL